MIDTNVLISAFVFGGKAKLLLEKLFLSNYELLVSDYVWKEFADKLKEKWPDKADKILSLFHKMDFVLCESTSLILGDVRDEKDIPVLSDAIYHKADIILSGDKDFLEAGLEKPLVFSPSILYDYLSH